MFSAVKEDGGGGYLCTLLDGGKWAVPNDPLNRHWQDVQKWVAEGGIVQLYVAPTLTYDQNRLIEYERQGVSAQALVVALWEQVVENRPQAAQALQTKRAAIKLAYPKP